MTDWVLSQSAIDTFDRCARRYYLRYVRGLDWPAPLTSTELDFEQAMRRGEHFHLLIQQHTLGMDVTPIVDAGDDPVLSDWWTSFQHHALTLLPKDALTSFTEVELAVAMEGVTLTAKFDHVVVTPDSVYIFDWKTGVPSSRERLALTWQSVVYQFVAAERGDQLSTTGPSQIEPESVKLVYWHAREPGAPVWLPYDRQIHERGRQRLAQIVGDIARLMATGEEASFERTPDASDCRHCPFRSYCERGREAAPLEDPEALTEVAEQMRVIEGPEEGLVGGQA